MGSLRGPVFLRRDGCPLGISRPQRASPASAGLFRGRQQHRSYKGQPKLGGKNTQDDFPLATLSWDPLCLLCRSAEERELADGSCLASGRKTLAASKLHDVKCSASSVCKSELLRRSGDALIAGFIGAASLVAANNVAS